jgi:CRP-like cAMP-binding protein
MNTNRVASLGLENHLIELLPRADRRRFLAACQPVQLVLSEVLCEQHAPTRAVYFPIDGFISLVAKADGHLGLEVGMVGREGMLGVELALGVAVAPMHALAQGAGAAWRMDASAFTAELARSAALRGVMQRYVYVLMAQLAVSSACLRYHAIGPRLARWLLMSQDRAHADRFHVTHEFLSFMLGVRRVGITAAAGAMHREGLIEYHRGELTVLDRLGLEAAACSCYADSCQTYAARL